MTKFLFVMISLPLLAFSFEEPIEPVVSNFEEIKVPEVTLQTPTNNLMILLRAQIEFSEGKTVTGNIRLTNELILSITNQSIGKIEIKKFSIYDIESISPVQWKPEKKDQDTYLFYPIRYEVKSEGKKYLYEGNIPELNSFEWDDDTGRKLFFTVFYDSWIAGKKNFYRWQNSKSGTFSYNCDHPIEGVVQKIEIMAGL